MKTEGPKCSIFLSCCNKCARNLGRFPKCILIRSRLKVVHCKQFPLLDGSKYKLLKNQKILFQLAARTVFQSYVYSVFEGRKAKICDNLPLNDTFSKSRCWFAYRKDFPAPQKSCTNSFSVCKLASAAYTHQFPGWYVRRNRCEI